MNGRVCLEQANRGRIEANDDRVPGGVCIMDRLQRVLIKDDGIGELAHFQVSGLTFEAKCFRAIQGGGSQNTFRRHPAFGEQNQFPMHGQTGGPNQIIPAEGRNPLAITAPQQ